MIGIIFIGNQTAQLLRLMNRDVLKEKDYSQITQTAQQVGTEIAPLTDIIQVEYRATRTTVSEIINNPREIYQLAYQYLSQNNTSHPSNSEVFFLFLSLYFNRGHMFRNYDHFSNYAIDIMSTKNYQEIMKMDWSKKVPTDILNRFVTPNYIKAYHQQILKVVQIRLVEIQSAINLHHLQKQQWPSRLDDLKEYLGQIPIDPFTDKPFLLGQENGKVYVYSPGPDNKDDKAQIVYDPTNGTISPGDIRS